MSDTFCSYRSRMPNLCNSNLYILKYLGSVVIRSLHPGMAQNRTSISEAGFRMHSEFLHL